MDDDAGIRFHVEIRADAVLPGTEDIDQPQVLKAAESEARAKPRKLYFLYTLGQVT